MATQPTNLPVPSEAPRDLKFNAGKIDEFVTSLVNTYIDRFGKQHYTIEGLRWLAQQAISQYGWIPVGTFQAGATLTLPNQILKDETDGEYYRWDGSFLPSGKVVPAGSTPASSGGMGIDKWLSVGDSLLRSELASTSGASLVNLANGKTVQQDSAQSGLARGNDGVKYALSGAAIRRDTSLSPNWQAVSDTAHLPVNVSGVTGGVDVNIQYKGSKIGSLIAGPDERFASDGVLVGASVSADNANISLGAPCSFFINLDSANAITFDTKFFDASRFEANIAASGLITITHPQRRLMQMPVCQHTSGGSLFEPLTPHYINTTSPGVTSLYLAGQAEGLISYNGSAWVIGSSSWSSSDISCSYNAATGELTVTHPALLGSPGCNITAWYNGEMINVSMKNVTTNGFVVVFRKASDNSIPAASAALGFYFDRGVSAIRKTPSGRLSVFLGHVQVNCDQVDYANGNFWFLSLMQDDTTP